MKILILIPVVFLHLVVNGQSVSGNNIDCLNGSMGEAWYAYNEDIKPVPITKIDLGFTIWVDITSIIRNMTYTYQEYVRKTFNPFGYRPDYLSYSKDFQKLTDKQKIAFLAQHNKNLSFTPDSLFIIDNTEHYKVWLLNYSTNPVSLQCQDGSLICILQGISPSGEWQPIQYWKFSRCGNSYYRNTIMPKTSSSFFSCTPNKGNYNTRLRFKILGYERFYYSNEFQGKINICDFDTDNKVSNLNNCYMLDTLVKKVYR